ncbi:MAG: hypothetical protein IT236_13015, partial [Bacteroidia bacterium]|nr:hypothetical protein [Bacteroidia bacterium]
MSNNENNQANNQPNNFGLPGGYFQKSAANLMNKIEWEDEHKAYPQLIGFKNKSGFIVPAGYFETNEAQLELINYPALKGLQKQTAFVAPKGYFDLAEETELSKVMEFPEKELGTFETLNAISKQNTFIVSENYFQDNENRLQVLLKESKTARVINL